MKITAELYEIENSDNFGYKLTANLPSDNPKSKTGISSKTTFHADLKQVAAKMVAYEIMASDAKDVFALADVVDAASARLVGALEACNENK